MPPRAANDQWFTDAYNAHVAAVLRHVSAILPAGDAEQVVHETFLQFWQDPTRHDPARGGLRTYLKLTARSRALDQLRSSSASDRRDSAWHRAAASIHQDVLPDGGRDEIRARLASLPEDQREPIVIAFFTGLSYAQVAERLGLPEGTVKWRIRAGLAQLRADLAPTTGSEELA